MAAVTRIMVSIFRLGSDVWWLCQPRPEAGRSPSAREPETVIPDHQAAGPGQGTGTVLTDLGLGPRGSFPPSSHTCAPTHPPMTRPPCFGGGTEFTHVPAHQQMLVFTDPFGQSGLFPGQAGQGGGMEGCGLMGGQPGLLVISTLVFKVPQTVKASQCNSGWKGAGRGSLRGRRPGVGPWQGWARHLASCLETWCPYLPRRLVPEDAPEPPVFEPQTQVAGRAHFDFSIPSNLDLQLSRLPPEPPP